METTLFIKAITYVYFLLNTIRVFSYVPQIVTVSKEKSTAKAISLWTWSFWTAANFITGLYATFVVKDVLLSLMSYGNTLGCGIVVGIVVFKRKHYAEVVANKGEVSEIASKEDIISLIRD